MSLLSRSFWILSSFILMLGSSSCRDEENPQRTQSNDGPSRPTEPNNGDLPPNRDPDGKGKDESKPEKKEPPKPFVELEQLFKLDAAKMKDVPPEQLKTLTPAELQTFSPAQIGALNGEQIQALATAGSRATLRDLTDEQLAALGSNLSGLKNLTPLEQANALSAEQFEKLSSIQQIWVYGLIHNLFSHRTEYNPTKRRWTPEEVRALTVDQLNSHKNDFKLLRELFLSISHFSPEQVAAINPVYMHYFWSVPWLSSAQVQALTTKQIQMMSTDQINLMAPSQSQALTEEQKQNLNDDVKRVAGLNAYFLNGLFPDLTLERVKNLTAQEISNLETKKLGNLEIKAVLLHLPSLNRDQLRAVAPNQMKFFAKSDLASLRTEHVAALRPEQISAIAADSFSGFSQTQIPHFTKEQIQAITVDQLDALRWHSDRVDVFTPTQMTYFTPETISRVDTSWIEKFLTEKHIAELTKEQIQALTIKQLDKLRWYSNHIDAITPTQMTYFTPETISRVDTSWIEKFLTPTHIAELTKEQIQALTVKQLGTLRWFSSHIEALTATQMSYFTPDTISRIDTSWIEKFLTPTHIAELSQEQIQVLTIKQLDVLRWHSPQKQALLARSNLLTQAQINALQ